MALGSPGNTSKNISGGSVDSKTCLATAKPGDRGARLRLLTRSRSRKYGYEYWYRVLTTYKHRKILKTLQGHYMSFRLRKEIGKKFRHNLHSPALPCV